MVINYNNELTVQFESCCPLQVLQGILFHTSQLYHFYIVKLTDVVSETAFQHPSLL